MSYSFSFKAATKEAANQLAAEQFDAMRAAQKIHERDREAALANAAAMIGLLREPLEGEDVQISMSGSLSWTGEPFDAATAALIGTNASCAAYIAKRTAA